MDEERIVVPGEKLCVIEEFLAGSGTRQSPNGIVYATVAGKVVYDMKRRVVNVKSIKELDKISVGDLVLGEVKELQNKIAVVRLIGRNEKSLKYPHTAILLADPRTGNLDNYIGVGDLIIGKVSHVYLDIIHITIWEPNLGVVLAACDVCGTIMERYQKNNKYNLICPKCQNKSSRKIVNYYGILKKLHSWLGISS